MIRWPVLFDWASSRRLYRRPRLATTPRAQPPGSPTCPYAHHAAGVTIRTPGTRNSTVLPVCCARQMLLSSRQRLDVLLKAHFHGRRICPPPSMVTFKLCNILSIALLSIFGSSNHSIIFPNPPFNLIRSLISN